MTRTEIIANRAVEEDLLERLRELGVPAAYTKFPAVHGAGSSGERHGDHIWPEENTLLLFYTNAETGRLIVNAARAVKRQFPTAGIKLFQYEIQALEL